MTLPAVRERRWARRLLALAGWRVRVVLPPGPRCVIAVYPHTSNWDFVVGYLAKLACGLPVHFVGKHTLFRPPFGAILRRMGGIPVDRRAAAGLVPQLVREMRARPWMWLAIAPEGTRSYVDHWKSGFHRLAVEAKVPIGLAFIDWRRRVVGLETYVDPTGDEAADLARIRAAYEGKAGKRPELAGAIRFRARRVP
ncbi:MAG TPA: lysophospholipid acyltransferase family protein [Anaeromyxobacter sp.]|nr:lysophospholipid acyltransferase family protein [Anaeromyxobacter sp.]